MQSSVDYRLRVGSVPEKYFKSTLFQSHRLLLGLNCLEPGQEQKVHEHADQDKFYFVLEGRGDFVVGDETLSAGPGEAIWSPAGARHGVSNSGQGRLVLLVGLAPGPSAGS